MHKFFVYSNKCILYGSEQKKVTKKSNRHDSRGTCIDKVSHRKSEHFICFGTTVVISIMCSI